MRAIAMAWRAGLSLAVPGGFLLLAAALVLRSGVRQDPWSSLLNAYPYVAIVAGLGLGLRFSQSRLALAVVMLAAVDRALLAHPEQSILYNAVAFLLPLNLALLGLLSERGLLTGRGLLRTVVLLIQAGGVYLLMRPEHADWAALLDRELVAPALTQWTTLPQTSLAAMAVAALILALRFIVVGGALDGGFFWALLASAMALHVRWDAAAATTYFATAQLVLSAAVIERSYAMAYRDELTGLPGRRALNERLAALGGRYAIAMVDVDHFKRLNDRYGHDTGDQVLRLIASQLRHVTGGGAAFRYGGEEFAVVFKRKDVAAAKPHLENLRLGIAGARFALRSADRPKRKPRGGRSRSTAAEVRITASVGVADSGSGRSADDVIRAADRALYRAKSGGRNCIRS